MITIGLTGSIAMGKSEVAATFRDHGIPVFDADLAVHALYHSQKGVDLVFPLVPQAIIENRVDRRVLSHALIRDADLLSRLESVVHQEIASERDKFLDGAKADGHEFAVLDIPLLFEKDGEKQVDVTIVVSAPLQQQRHRALSRQGMTEEKFAMILGRQMPDAEKRRRADHVIINDGTIAQLRQRALAVLSKIKKEHGL